MDLSNPVGIVFQNQDKLDALSEILSQYSQEGLPSMPELVVMGQTKYEESLFFTERHWTDFVDQAESEVCKPIMKYCLELAPPSDLYI